MTPVSFFFSIGLRLLGLSFYMHVLHFFSAKLLSSSRALPSCDHDCFPWEFSSCAIIDRNKTICTGWCLLVFLSDLSHGPFRYRVKLFGPTRVFGHPMDLEKLREVRLRFTAEARSHHRIHSSFRVLTIFFSETSPYRRVVCGLE